MSVSNLFASTCCRPAVLHDHEMVEARMSDWSVGGEDAVIHPAFSRNIMQNCLRPEIVDSGDSPAKLWPVTGCVLEEQLVEESPSARLGAALRSAAANGDDWELRRLIGIAKTDQGEATLNQAIRSQDMDGWTALHFACYGSSPSHTEAVRRLCKLRADPGVPDPQGWTPLHVAGLFGEPVAVHVLLKTTASLGQSPSYPSNLNSGLSRKPSGTSARFQKYLKLQQLDDEIAHQPTFEPGLVTVELMNSLQHDIVAETTDQERRRLMMGSEGRCLETALDIGLKDPLTSEQAQWLLDRTYLRQAEFLASRLQKHLEDGRAV